MPHGCGRVGGCCASRVGWWTRGRGGRGRGVGWCARGVCVAVRCRKRLAALARLRHTGRLPRRASSGCSRPPRVPRPSNRSVASVRHAPTSSSPPSPLSQLAAYLLSFWVANRCFQVSYWGAARDQAALLQHASCRPPRVLAAHTAARHGTEHSPLGLWPTPLNAPRPARALPALPA